MTYSPAHPALRLHRLVLTREEDPAWSGLAEPTLPGVLEVPGDPCVHLLACPDVVTLVTSLWHRRPYGARGQMLRPVLAEPETVRLEAVWSSGSAVIAQMPLSVWSQQLTRLAGQVADVLTAAGERSLVELLAPALAGPGAIPARQV